MPTFLCIETATAVCSVALTRDGLLLAERESVEGFLHAEKLAVFVKEVMSESNLGFHDLDAVVVSGGPGSYTGLRIGVSTAKGICWSVDKPLIAVPTLKAMAAGAAKLTADIGSETGLLLCPMIDARRMEVYTSLYDYSLTELAAASAKVIEGIPFEDELSGRTLCYFGDGAGKCTTVFGASSKTQFLEEYRMNAFQLAVPAAEDFLAGRFAHTALYEPFYLKEFVAGKGSSLPKA